MNEIQEKIASKYHDGFNKSIMVSEEATLAKNEILRKIMMYKAKQTNLQNFTRKKKEELLTERLERQRVMMKERSMETFYST